MMIRKLAPVALLGVATVLMICASAQAQPGGGRGRDGGGRGFGGGRGGFGFGGPMALVGRRDVQEELQLTSGQRDQIESLQESLRPDFGGDRGGFGNFREMSDEERQEAFAKMRDQRKQEQEVAAKLKDILNSNQAKRLGELELQFALQRVKNDDQLSVLAAYIDEDKLQAAIGEPFEFETGFGGFGRGGRGDRGGPGARGGDRDGGSSDDGDTGGRRRRRGA